MTISCWVVHHPARDEILPELLDRLGDGVPKHVVVDDEPERRNPWINWRRTLEQVAASGDTHALVIENDITPCLDFVAGVRKIVELRPDDLVRYYHPSEPYGVSDWRQAQEREEHWFPISDHWGCVQAISLPVAWVEPFLHYGQSFPGKFGLYPDARLTSWMQTRKKRPVWTTVPSLARHAWPSMCGQPHHDCPDELWIGDDVSALSIDWTKGL